MLPASLYHHDFLKSEILTRTSSWCRHKLEAACQTFHEILRHTELLFPLFSEAQVFKMKQSSKTKQNCLSCPWGHLFLSQLFSFIPSSFLLNSLHPFFHNLPPGNKLRTQFLPAVALRRLYKRNHLGWNHWGKRRAGRQFIRLRSQKNQIFFGIVRQVWEARTTFFFYLHLQHINANAEDPFLSKSTLEICIFCLLRNSNHQ